MSEAFEVCQAKPIFYTIHFRKELNTTKCRVQDQQEKGHFVHDGDSSMDHTLAGGIKSTLVKTLEYFQTMPTQRELVLPNVIRKSGRIKKEAIISIQCLRHDTIRTLSKKWSCFARKTLSPHLQRTTLKVRLSWGNVSTESGQVPRCFLEELGCKTTSLYPYAYNRDFPDNCVQSVFRTKDAKKNNELQNTFWVEHNQQPNSPLFPEAATSTFYSWDSANFCATEVLFVRMFKFMSTFFKWWCSTNPILWICNPGWLKLSFFKFWSRAFSFFSIWLSFLIVNEMITSFSFFTLHCSQVVAKWILARFVRVTK